MSECNCMTSEECFCNDFPTPFQMAQKDLTDSQARVRELESELVGLAKSIEWMHNGFHAPNKACSIRSYEILNKASTILKELEG